MLREEAYRWVQRNAMRAWTEGLNFRQLVLEDADISARVPREKVERAFDLKRQLRNVDKIFVRAFGQAKPARTSQRKKPSTKKKTAR